MRGAVLVGVRNKQANLSLRQFAVALTVYLTDEPQTVRGLAKHLAIIKPAITRAFDRLEIFGLIRRRIDPMDRRSVFAERTAAGAGMIARLRKALS